MKLKSRPGVFVLCTAFAAAAVLGGCSGGSPAGRQEVPESDGGAPAPAAALKTNSTPAGFTDDLDAALARAAREGKMVLAVFSGSDWCGICMQFEKEILSKPGFVDGAGKKFVLAFIDLPQEEALLSAHAKAANKGLAEKYGVNGFPTVLLLDASGRMRAQTGYEDGDDVASCLKRLDATMARANQVAALADKIKDLKAGSPERVKALDAVLAGFDAEAQQGYAEWVREILSADPDGKLGYRPHYPYFVFIAPFVERLTALYKEHEADYDAMVIRLGGSPDAMKRMPAAARQAFADKVNRTVALEVLPGLADKFAAVAAEVRKTSMPKSMQEMADGLAGELEAMAKELRGQAAEAKKNAAKAVPDSAD